MVILVGQQVLGATADHRARDIYKDAEPILQQIEALHQHLAVQARPLNAI